MIRYLNNDEKHKCDLSYEQVLTVSSDFKTITLYSLVLTARGIPHFLKKDGDKFLIFVDKEFFEKAAIEIRLYLSENKNFFQKKSNDEVTFQHLKKVF